MLYYGIDHKVGAVGVLYPLAGNSGISAVVNEAHFQLYKTNVRQQKPSAVFSSQATKKHLLVLSFPFICSARVKRSVLPLP